MNDPVQTADPFEAEPRRINKLPLALGLGLLLIVVIVFFWAMANRLSPSEGRIKKAEKLPAVSAEMPGMVDAPKGVIPADNQTAQSAALPSPPVESSTRGLIPAANDGRPRPGASPVRAVDNSAFAKMLEEQELQRRQYYLERDLDRVKYVDTKRYNAFDSTTSLALPSIDNSRVGQSAADTRRASYTSASAGSVSQSPYGGPIDPTGGAEAQAQLIEAALSRAAGGGSGSDDPNGQSRKANFAGQADEDPDYLSNYLRNPKSPYEVKQGTIIPGIMITGINSDLPGRIIAQVSQDVYDTTTGAYLLIPQGTRLFGRYDSEVTFGQNRALVVWTRIIFPNGVAINIDAMGGSDQAGYSGFNDKVNKHILSTYGHALLLSVIGGGIEALSGNNNTDSEIAQAIRRNSGDEFRDVTAKVIDRNLDVQPTIKIRPGYRFVVMVDQDIVLKEYNDGR